MADRFFCPDPPVGDRLALGGDEAHHLARVRRVGVGEVVEVFDGRGFATRAEVVALGRDRVELVAVGDPLPDRAAAIRLTLATAVPKGERFDWLVEKATELGVSRLVPIVTDRSVVDPRAAKLDRLRRVVVEASKQSGRNRLMELAPPSPWAAVVADRGDPVRLLAHPVGVPARDWPLVRRGGPATLAVGPEGGFTGEEVEEALAAGWLAVSLGETLLRVETAGLAGCATLLALGGGGD